MQTPRPDRFTYPLHGDPMRPGEIVLKKRWMRAVLGGGLIAALALGILIGFYH